MLKPTAAFFAVLMLTGASFAQIQSCDAKASEKKLAGAAKTSFVKKCEQDAVTACEAMSKEKKLAGAAKTSFEKKCVKDAQG